LSPDGRWLAVEARQLGRSQIYVLPYPALDTRFTVSVEGGTWPRWPTGGRELFYLSEDVRLMSVSVAGGSVFEASQPTQVFPLPLLPLLNEVSPDSPPPYDVAAGGQRFVFCLPPEHHASRLATVITDWEGLVR
jgi:hypothetical protein